jgi:hypothetical protein
MDAPVRRRDVPFINGRIVIGKSQSGSFARDDFEGGIPELQIASQGAKAF